RALPLFGDARPRSEVHFVDRDGAVEPGVVAGAIDEPLRVVPLVLAARHDRRGQRRHLEAEAEGIGLEQQLAPQLRANLELVVVPDLRAGNENLPDADRVEPAYGVR